MNQSIAAATAAYRQTYYEQEMEEDLGEVDLDLAIGNYGQNGGAGAMYDEGACLLLVCMHGREGG